MRLKLLPCPLYLHCTKNTLQPAWARFKSIVVLYPRLLPHNHFKGKKCSSNIKFVAFPIKVYKTLELFSVVFVLILPRCPGHSESQTEGESNPIKTCDCTRLCSASQNQLVQNQLVQQQPHRGSFYQILK